MQNIIIRTADFADLDAVTALEQVCFTEADAASRSVFSQRMHSFPECFWLAESGGNIVSMINGMTTGCRDLTDEMYGDTALYSADGAWLMLFGVATHPGYQKHVLASRLMSHVIDEMKRKEKCGIVLTCTEELLPFFQRFGFVSEGISDSVYGGAVWYQMRLDFQEELYRCACSGGECSFYQNGWRYLLYGWRQCDGDYLNVSDETGQMIWQTAKSGQAACDDFTVAYRSQALY